jgi:HEAT repeat protein
MASLQRSLVDRKIELRRSAAVALGGVQSDLVLPRLMTAYELEEEPLTRGFLLLSIAERGGAHAVPFLRTELRDGPQRLRPWAALALGMVAYGSEVPEARAALAGAKVATRDSGALLLARGMAHDYAALPELRTALDDADNPMTRAYAATALGLLGGDHARYALLARARVETHAQVRVYIVQSLGLIGHSADADFIVKCARETHQEPLQVLVAVALGFHGTEAVLDGAEDLLLDVHAAPATVATAIESIGVLLDREPGLALPQLSRRTNFSVMPGWLREVLSSPL